MLILVKEGNIYPMVEKVTGKKRSHLLLTEATTSVTAVHNTFRDKQLKLVPLHNMKAWGGVEV